MADVITDMTAYSNQVLLDAAELAGVSVWSVIGAIAGVILLLLILVVWLIERKHYAAAPAPISVVQGEFIEKTLAEIPVAMVKTD
ncbi:hypothetical protein KKA03_00695, partial [archaeon]|nr:hypothetical protein [archaeon]